LFTYTFERTREVVDSEGNPTTEKYNAIEQFLLTRKDFVTNSVTEEEMDQFKAKFTKDMTYIDDEYICKQACNQDPECFTFYFELTSVSGGISHLCRLITIDRN
jgi:hypothetical protein